MSAVAFSAMLAHGHQYTEANNRGGTGRQETVRSTRRTVSDSNDIKQVLSEMRSFRMFTEKRLDDVTRDLSRVFEHQQVMKMSQERFYRLHHGSQECPHSPHGPPHGGTRTLNHSGSYISTTVPTQAAAGDDEGDEEEHSRRSESTTTHELPQQGHVHSTDEALAASMSPDDLRPEFDEPYNLAPRGYASNRRIGRSSPTASMYMPAEVARQDSEVRRKCWNLHPHSYACLLWDLTSILMLAYDLLLLPVILAWELPQEGVVLYGSWTTVLFWTIDVVVSLLKGHEVELNSIVYGWRALERYFKSWFVLDLLVLVVDWTAILLEILRGDAGSGDSSVTDIIKLFRILKLNRFVRVVAVIKMGRLNRLLDSMNRTLLSVAMLGDAKIIFRVGRFITPAMLINHWVACIWYVVGKELPDAGGTSWLLSLQAREAGFEYSLALQWAVSHMFGGSPVVLATSSAESIFTVVAMVLGAICGSILISLVATVMMDLQNATLTRRKTLYEVQRFVHDNRVGNHLSAAILRQVKERTDTRTELLLKDVPILAALSPPLWRELAYHLFAPKILVHGFLHVCDQVNQNCMKDLCSSAIHELVIASHDELFSCGHDGSAAHLIKAGGILYYDGTTQVETNLHEGQYIAEVAIWLRWQYRGTAVASRPSEILEVSVPDFARVMKAYADIATLAHAFGQAVAAYLKRLPQDTLNDLPLQMPPASVEWDTLMLLMPADMKYAMSKPVMDELHYGSWSAFLRRRKGAMDLATEVEKGGCLLKMDRSKRIVRTVSVSVLRLKDSAGRELVHMGNLFSTSQLATSSPVCEYPATKVFAGESPEDALHRLIKKDMPMLAAHLQVTSSEVVTQESDSTSYGLPTKYFRTVFHAKLGQRESERVGKEVTARPSNTKQRQVADMKSLRSNTTSWVRRGITPQTTVKSAQSMPSTMIWSTRGSDRAGTTSEDSFDQDHKTTAYTLSPPGRSSDSPIGRGIFAWITQEEFHNLKQRKSSLQPWLQELSLENDWSEDDIHLEEHGVPSQSVPMSRWRKAFSERAGGEDEEADVLSLYTECIHHLDEAEAKQKD